MKVIRSRDITFNEDALYKYDLAKTKSKRKQSPKAVFEELRDTDVLQPKIGEGLENSGSVEESKY